MDRAEHGLWWRTGPLGRSWTLLPYLAQSFARLADVLSLLLLEGVVAPVHEGVAPVGVLDIVLGPLPEVALDVGVDPLHVLDVVVCVVGLVLALKAVVNEVGPPPRRLLSSIAREASECPTRPPQTWQVAEVQYHCTTL